MKKIYITLIIGILIVGVVSSLAFGLDKKDFTKKIDKMNAKKFCDKNKEMIKIEKKECKDLEKDNYKIDITNSGIEIKQNPKTGILMVRAE